MRKILLGLAFAFALTGCSTIESVLSPSPNVVATLQASLAAADSAALGYVQLPACGTSVAAGSSFCSDKTVVAKIKIYSDTAYTAVMAARANEGADTITAAQNAVSAFQTVVSALKTPTAPAVPTTASSATSQ